MQPLRILALHAHPDDVEILGGGTMSALGEAGHELVMATMTAGDCGSATQPADVISSIRQGEAAAAAALLNARYFCLGFRDLAVFIDDVSRRRVTAFLREHRPSIVLTASPADYHCDHEATSALVRDACFAAPAPNYEAGTAEPLEGIPHLYFFDPVEGTDRERREMQPGFVVDVSAHISRKRELLACHASQRDWLRKHHGMDDYLETMERWSQQRGALIKAAYGEGFRQYTCHPYPVSPLLQEALKPLAVPC